MLEDGVLLLANDRFLSLFGFHTVADIEAVNLLDLTVDLDKTDLRDFLRLATLVDEHDANHPQLKISFRRRDGSKFQVDCFAYRQRLDGEDVIELALVTQEDRKLLNRVLNLPWKLYLCFLCLIALIAVPNVLLPRLNVNNAPATFLPDSAPSVVLNEQVRELFPDDEVVILLFEGVALFSDGFLLAYDNLRQELEQRESIVDVIAVTRQDHISGSEDGFQVSPLLDIEELDQQHPRQRLQTAIADRFASGSLVAKDGSAIAMVVIPEALNNSILNMALEDDILALVKKHRLDGYLTAMAGEITIDVAQMRVILRDNMIFIPVTVFVGLLLTWILFQRVLPVITTGVVTGAVVNTTIAFYVLLQQPFNSISGIIPPLLSALTMAALVHFYNAQHYASKRGLVGRARVQAALDEIRRPALFSALTTSVGLASLGLSPIPPISTFGLTAAAGVFLIYIIVIHILPPIFVHFDNRDWPSRRAGLVLMDKMVRLLFHTGIRKPGWVIGLICLPLLVTLPAITTIKVETNILDFFRAGHPLRVSTDHIEEKLVGSTPMEVVFSTDEPEGLIAPENLVFLRELQNWIRSLPTVDKTMSIADFVEEMHWGFNGEDPDMRVIPEDPELISQYLFVYDGEDLYDFITEDYQTARVVLNVNVHGANEISELMDAIDERLEGSVPAGLEWKITGAARMFADQEDLLIEGQVKSLGGALVLIFVLMLMLWRSIRDAAICMIPNLSPILLIFILMGLLSINLDLATAMIASVAVGIAIDDTIHVYHGFIHRVRKGIRPVVALARTYRQAGRAVMTTTVVLCAQFLLMLASIFVPMGNFGLLATAGLLAALVFDLMLLPALLIVIFSRKRVNPAPVSSPG